MPNLRLSLGKLPIHIILIGMCAVWIVPALGLLVTSFRPFQDVDSTGWWTVFSPPPGAAEYQQNCASCHGSDGRTLPNANLTDPNLIGNFRRSITLGADLKKQINGQPHMGTIPVPNDQTTATIATYLRRISGIDTNSTFTLNNYIDALVGYRGTRNYTTDCAANAQAPDLHCDATDLSNPRGMGDALVNTLVVTIPATFLPIIFAAFAAYAMSWLHFPGRQWMFAILVGLQVVPLQMTLEAAYLDGANHWTAFRRLALPLSVPALASLGIFQFLWIWNDLLVALVFLGGDHPVLTYQIGTLVSSLGAGWHLLTAAAFISMLLPMIVFFSLQRFFVRGLLAGSVKG